MATGSKRVKRAQRRARKARLKAESTGREPAEHPGSETPSPSELAPVHGKSWLLLLAPLLALVTSLTLSYLWNEDFWWYLTSGQAILENGGIPDEDPFLFTSENGIGWVYHSWLWTVVVAGLESFAGLDGVVVFHALMAVAVIALLYTTARVDRLGLVNALAVLLVLVTMKHRLCGKAEIATWLMLILFFRILEHGGRFTWRRGAALGLLQVLWANLHGGYPLGVFLAACYAVGGWLQERLVPGERGDEGRHPPIWFPGLLFLLAVADPRMFMERLAPFGFVTGSTAVQPVGESGTMLILEWRSPFSAGLADPALPWLFAVAALAGLASFAASGRRSLPRLLFLLGMAGLGASAIRHLSGLALAAALVLLANLGDRPRREGAGIRTRRARDGTGRASPPRWLYPASGALLALLLAAGALALRVSREGFEGGQSSSFFTVRPATACPGAADFILDHELPGPIFNDYQLGGYLGARLFPKYRVFIDSRVLDPSVVVEYTKMVQSEPRWRNAEEKYGFRTAVLGNYSKTVRSALGATLLRDPSWRLVFIDPLAVVFVRQDASIDPVARPRFESALGPRVPFLDPPGFPLAGVPQRVLLSDFPSNFLIEYLANLGHLGRGRDVLDLTTEALAAMPEHPLLLRQRCAANLVQGNLMAALDDCAQAYSLRPADKQIIWLHANVLQRAGRSAEALSVLDDALRLHPKDADLRKLRRSLTR